MSHLRCLIVDDEALARQELRALLSQEPGVEVVGEAANISSALEQTAAHRPDAVFVDIKLRSENGFDYVAALPEPLPHLVFATAYDRFALRAFDCNAVDYLLKPIHPVRLAETLARIRARLRTPPAAGGPLFLKTGARIRLHEWEDIRHILSEGNYTRIFLGDGTSVLKLRTLKEWLQLAPEGALLQIHRQAAVRPSAIREITTEGDHRHHLILNDGTRLPIGRAYWPGLRALAG